MNIYPFEKFEEGSSNGGRPRFLRFNEDRSFGDVIGARNGISIFPQFVVLVLLMVEDNNDDDDDDDDVGGGGAW